MTLYTEQELVTLLRDDESQVVERKRSGGLYGKVTPGNIGTRATDCRNPLLAEIMHHLGFAQRFGIGVPRARKALADNGNRAP